MHPKINAALVVKTFQNEVFPHCEKHGYKLIIVDNDSKFHCKALVLAAEAEGIQIYPGSGKRVWVTPLILQDRGDPEKTTTKYLINVSILRIAKRAQEKQSKESIPLEVTTACHQKRSLRTHLKMHK